MFYKIIAGPAPRGCIPGPCPPNDCLCPPKRKLCPPPSEDYAPKKLTGSGLLECKSRSETPKLVSTARIFVIFVDSHRISYETFRTNTFFFGFHLRIREKSQEFRDDNRICGDFCTEDLFFGLHLIHLIHTRINFSCPRAPSNSHQ